MPNKPRSSPLALYLNHAKGEDIADAGVRMLLVRAKQGARAAATLYLPFGKQYATKQFA